MTDIEYAAYHMGQAREKLGMAMLDAITAERQNTLRALADSLKEAQELAALIVAEDKTQAADKG
jgi:hypothetical protein